MILLPFLFAPLCASAPSHWVGYEQAVRMLASGVQVLDDHVQIVSDHAQPDPTLHACGPMIAIAVQSVVPCEPTDPPFDPSAPVAPGPKPVLLLVCDPFRPTSCRAWAAPPPRDTALLGIEFVGGGMQVTVTARQGGSRFHLFSLLYFTSLHYV